MRAHRVHPHRVEVEVVQQGRARLPVVALGVLGRDEPLVTPPDVHLSPVHRAPGRGPAERVQGSDADAAAGQHDRGGPAQRLGVDQSGDQPSGHGGGQHLRVLGDDDDRGRAHVVVRAGSGTPSSVGSCQTCVRTGARPASGGDPVAAARACA